MAQEPFRAFKETSDFLGSFGLLETEAGVLLVANRRVIDGAEQTVWDLPGGRVEAGETLSEALRREWREECAIDVTVHEMLFVSEGERVHGGRRSGVWRSFFFRVEGSVEGIDHSGEPDILDHAFVPRAELPPLLQAPYHKGFLEWLASDGETRYVSDCWVD
ncbi:MAG: NUDIX hydrolase [Planctomycetota bacterium]|jgi:ADP-ribose pyrophosphatase YjhB (NUDIX family)